MVRYCGSVAVLKCSRCKLVYYCNQQHQRSHWRLHKKQCNNKEPPVLPAVIWEDIFSFLSLPSLLSVRTVCHLFREISNQNFIWESLLRSNKSDVYSNIVLHNKFNTARDGLIRKDETLAAAVTDLRLETDALSEPGSLMQSYMKHCVSIQNQNKGNYRITHKSGDDDYIPRHHHCDGALLAIYEGYKGEIVTQGRVRVWLVSYCFKHLHTIDLPSGGGKVNVFDNHLSIVAGNRVRVYEINRRQLTFTLKHEIAISESYSKYGWNDRVRFSEDRMAVLVRELSVQQVIKVFSLSSGKSLGVIPLNLPAPVPGTDFCELSLFELKQKYAYLIHQDRGEVVIDEETEALYEKVVPSLVDCYDLETRTKVFETCVPNHPLSSILISNDGKFLFAYHSQSGDVDSRGVANAKIINGKTGAILKEVPLPPNAINFDFHVDWKNEQFLCSLRGEHYRGVCGSVISFNGSRVYSIKSDPEDSSISSLCVHNDLIFSVVEDKIVVRGLKDGKVKYKISLPATSDMDNWRVGMYIDDYKVILCNKHDLALVNFT